MPKIVDRKVVFPNKFLEVVELTIESDTGRRSPYFAYRHPWSNSTGVAILCYRDVEEAIGFGFPEEAGTYREYLGRYEFLPAHGEEMKLGSITGAYDKPDETHVQCAIRELEEEGGFAVRDNTKVIDLGRVKNSKSSQNTMHLFAVNVRDCVPVEAGGDGTISEEGSYVKWVSEEKAVWSDDALLPVMIQRLNSLRR